LIKAKRRAKELKKSGDANEKKSLGNHISELTNKLKTLEVSLDPVVKQSLGEQAETQVPEDPQEIELDAASEQLVDEEEGNDDELIGGMFEETDEPTGPTSTLVKILDLSFKGWTGTYPSDLLREWLQKNKRLATFSISLVPQSSSGYKAQLKLKTKESEQAFQMSQDEYVRDKKDAKEFIALKTLYHFSSTYQILSRVPPPFRDVWDQWSTKEALEKQAAEQARDDERDEFVKELFKEIEAKSNEKLSVQKNPAKLNHLNMSNQRRSKMTHASTLKTSFLEKQASDAYRKLLETRKSLPIFSEKQNIIETIRSNQVTVIAGETGSGKSTQIPHFVLESAVLSGEDAGLNIICTQPRRISAISLADRVSAEMGDTPNTLGTPKSFVGYQVRMENCTSKSTFLTYCTTVGRYLGAYPYNSKFKSGYLGNPITAPCW
jgi:ATP-dependent RNA helicase DHX29